MDQTATELGVINLPKATLGETLAVLADVILPTLAKGVLIRRPPVVALAERLGLDRRAVRRLQRLRDRYGTGPLLLRLPVRNQAVILEPAHVCLVLDGSPEPFAVASSEKRAALGHFQPQGLLASHGAERAERRRLNEAVLDTGQAMHRLAERFVAVIDEEAGLLLGAVRHRDELIWDDFALTWFRIVRRLVLGDAARDDHALTEMLARLRANANWAFLRPKQRRLRQRFFERLTSHLQRAEPGSLAAVMAATPQTERSAPEQQVPQWLFAFDPAGMATFRALALLAAHPAHAAQARQELAGRDGLMRAELPFLRACVQESVRLWPTTPMILRQTTRETHWETGVMPPRTGILIFTPFFHRDDARLPETDRFAPELWLEPNATRDWPLVPFSDGPAVCPGRDLVLLAGSTMLAALLAGRQPRLTSGQLLSPAQPLPATLNPYALRFALEVA
jgi:cytochrome P450